jgi:hypothetical protein
MTLDGLLAAALRDAGGPLAELSDELRHPCSTSVEVGRFALDLRAQHRHSR